MREVFTSERTTYFLHILYTCDNIIYIVHRYVLYAQKK